MKTNKLVNCPLLFLSEKNLCLAAADGRCPLGCFRKENQQGDFFYYIKLKDCFSSDSVEDFTKSLINSPGVKILTSDDWPQRASSKIKKLSQNSNTEPGSVIVFAFCYDDGLNTSANFLAFAQIMSKIKKNISLIEIIEAL